MSGPLPGVLSPLTVPLSWLYGGLVGLRNRRYDRGAGVERVAVPVISVGNISAGGAGKSPFSAWLAERLLAAGHRPVIAMRGYGGRTGSGRSDEEAELAERLPGVDVLAAPDRGRALRVYLPAHRDVDCVILDDGFQHRRLHRDLDLVLVDATRCPRRDRPLPAGFLREPAASLRRADAVVVTRAEAVDDELAEHVARLHGAAPIAWARHVWTGLRVRAGGAEETTDVNWLRGKRVAALCGVAHPGAVHRMIEDAGAEVTVIRARDHERYTRRKLDRARRAAAARDGLFVTGKDWAKIRHLIEWRRWTVPVVVPDLVIDVFDGSAPLTDRLLRAIAPLPRPNPTPA